MRTSEGNGLASRSQDARLIAFDSTLLALISGISRFPPILLLRIQQASSDQVQVSERSGDFKSMQVFRQAPIAGLAEAEDVLDYAEHVLDLGAYPRPVAILCLLNLIDPAVLAVPAIGEVLRVRGTRGDCQKSCVSVSR